MAHIRKRKHSDGRDRYQVCFSDQFGRRHAITVGTRKRDAQKVLDDIMVEVREGTYGLGDKRFDIFCETFMNSKEAEVELSTLNDYRSIISNHLAPFFKRIRIDEIGPIHVELLLSQLKAKGLSAATVSKIKRSLGTIMEHAVRLELIPRNPVRGIRGPRSNPREMDFFNSDEVRQLIDANKGEERAFLALLCYTGLRIGEALALDGESIDLENREIVVDKQWRPMEGIKQTKTKAGNRVVPIIRQLYDELLAFYEQRGVPADHEVVFYNFGGSRYDLVRKALDPCFEEAGLRLLRPHELRHTFCSLCLEAGIDFKTISTWLGHSTIRLTMDVYGHLSRATIKRAALNLETVVDGGFRVVPFPFSEQGNDSQAV